MIDYTLVVGVDEYHLKQLELVWPTWRRFKPALLEHPMVVFYDHRQVSEVRVRAVVDHPQLLCIPWPINGLACPEKVNGEIGKWNNPRREMMLSGFVYVPALFVGTKYWLKLDTDVVATPFNSPSIDKVLNQEEWIAPEWFGVDTAIVAHRWTFTKPADQMLMLDEWVDENILNMPISVCQNPPLNLVPEEGWERLNHNRIISWCSFFDTAWTNRVARLTEVEDGRFRMPVPSQDGFLWYMATRMKRGVVRANMKSLGWEHWSTWKNVERRSREVMDGVETPS